MKRALHDKINECYIKSKGLRGATLDPLCNFNKAQKIIKIQDGYYKKFIFFKNLNKAMQKSKNCQKSQAK